ncbi:MAG TPA: carbamate kinase [Candidatus Anaerobutyricum stercoris]|uniref:Carbamate kinase n=1 Tax=Candidatus Anaerobutyricum stercoris TaxID=2838457 RepID=A0A9D2EM43_9FIRM|nr:carbamate kinase [Eubacterium sp. An3]OUO27459.1 carbamate kinase [Eubacterium sp. An3]HIZ39870.1 carbamate kinase [Candidatus Anaerobutyricum stercoris]
MSRKKVVVALGHRALGTTLPEQYEATKRTAKILANLVEAGADIVISHSNAPQVGMIHTAMNEFGAKRKDYTQAPMSVCSAMSQGYIGYDLQNALRAELLTRGISKPVCTIITQVMVDPYDDAFSEPVKIIGRLLTKEEADKEERNGNYVTEVEGGYRRIVAAPKPQGIIEIDSIRTLSDAGHVVIACGGGGIPVLAQGVQLKGASAIIEKDYASGRLAELLNADELMILTSVEHVSIGYHTTSETPLNEITVEQAKQYMSEDQFEPNTMLPKVEAGVSFIEKGAGRRVVITSIDKALEGYLGKTGTIIR